MLMTLITFLSALSISVIAIYYSVAGLAAIFAAAVVPIVVMGVALELGKLVTAVWLHRYWKIAAWWLKTYLSIAVVVLMFITSMGIFGFLSKAHLDQTLISGDAQASIAVYDEKIKNQRNIIEANQKLIQQMDDVVNQTMSRTTAAQGAERALQIRRSQANDRKRLVDEIAAAQKEIASISEQRAPLAASMRRIEAEVGPIKYIAEFVYGERADQNMLEEAVRWVIIILIFVFDPLAVLLLIASQYTWDYYREEKKRKKEETSKEEQNDKKIEEPKEEPVKDLGPLDPWPFLVRERDNELVQTNTAQTATPSQDITSPGKSDDGKIVERDTDTTAREPVQEPEEVKVEEPKKKPLKSLDLSDSAPLTDEELKREAEYNAKEMNSEFQNAKTSWKAAHPDQTLKMYKTLYIKGRIDKLPWEEDDAGYKQNSEQSTNTLFNKIRKDS